MRDDPQTSSLSLLLGLAKAIPAIALAIVFGWMAYFIRGNGGREIDWFGPAFFAILAGASAVWTIMRAAAKPRGPRPKDPRVADADAEPAFDADAALRRYMAARGTTSPVSEVGASEPAAPRPVFGRKIR